MGISLLLNAPLFEGAANTSEVPFPFPVAIGGHPYFIDTEQYERATIDLLRQAYDQQTEVGDQSLSIEGFWKRTQNDWRLGAGQQFLDDGGERERVYVSKGVNPWEPREISLLNDTYEVFDTAQASLFLATAGHGGSKYLFVGDGTALRYTADPTVAGLTAITGTPGAAIADMSTDGQTVWAAFGSSGVYKVTAATPGAATQLSTVTTSIVRFANNHLLGAHLNELFEILADGTKSQIMEHYNTNFTFAAIAGAPTGIFVGGNSFESGQFYYVGYNAETQNLAFPIPAGSLPDGEKVLALAGYGGILVIGTSRGIRLAEIVNGQGVAYGPLIDIGQAVRALEPQDDEVWFSWDNYDTGSTGLGRLKLSRFVAPLVPAHASDLMTSGSGIVTSIATYDDRRYFAVASSGIFGETGQKVASGYFDSGKMNFSTPEIKVAASLEVRHAPLAGTVAGAVISESGIVSDVGTSDLADSSAPGTAWGARSLRAEYFQVRITLTRSATDPTEGPVLYRWTFRAIVAPTQAEAFTVPVILYDRVNSGVAGGYDYAFDPNIEWDYLKGLEQTRSPVTYQEGKRSYLVTVRSVGIPAGGVRGWDADRNQFNSTVFVRLVTLDIGNGS